MMELLSPVLTIALAVASVVVYLALRKQKSGGGLSWLPGAGNREPRQIAVIDRIALTHQHSLHLVSMRGRWMAVAVTPQGCQLLESGPEQRGGGTQG
jgi:flagellar biogenesis protein FliO